jgi:hypothetical protein
MNKMKHYRTKLKQKIRLRILGATTLSIMTFSIMTLSVTTLSIMTLSVTTLSIMTLSITTFSITIRKYNIYHNDTQLNDNFCLC